MKKTIFGAILAAFLVLSVGFIVPVQVQAVEPDELKNKIMDLAENLGDNKADLAELLKDGSLNSKIVEMYNIIKNEPENMDSLLKVKATEYKNALFAHDKFQDLISKSSNENIQNIKDDINDLLKSVTDNNQGSSANYKIAMEDDVLTITKQYAKAVSGEAVLITDDFELKIPYDDGTTTILQDIARMILKIIIIVLSVLAGSGLVERVITLVATFLTGIVTAISDAIGTLTQYVDLSVIDNILDSFNLFLLAIVFVLFVAFMAVCVVFTLGYEDVDDVIEEVENIINKVILELNKLLDKLADKTGSFSGPIAVFLAKVRTKMERLLDLIDALQALIA
jgi:hypothetical protein